MDTTDLKPISDNVKDVANLMLAPNITAEQLERCAKTLHIAAQTLLLIADKP